MCQIQGCPRQDLPFAGAPSLLRHTQTMHAVTKSKELEVHQALRDAQIAFEYQHHLPFRGCGLGSETAHAFADFALPAPWGYVLLEVDEEQHKAYDPSCDVRRDFDMVALGSGHKLLALRYNPDAFKIAGMTRRTTKKERHAQLIRQLGGLLAREPGRGEQRAALRGGALVRARARRAPLRLESGSFLGDRGNPVLGTGLNGAILRWPREDWIFFPGKNPDLGAGLAGWRLHCRAGGAAGWRAR